ncbi:MAG: phosphatase PAP2 family protein [Anaerolineae bacterium]|nr:phosphatase PAP2 family protein [Anaerolineae bacterium]
MENILDWGIQIVLWFQQFSPTLDFPFKAITFLGEETFLLVFLPLFYWCIDRALGARLGVLFLVADYIGGWAKVLTDQPRPFQYDTRVKMIFETTGKAFPSLHTINAVIIWGYLATQLRRLWLWIIAGVLMVLIPLSRMYLGLHFPTDLLGGYIIAGTLLWFYLRFDPVVEKWLQEQGLKWQLGLAISTPFLLLLLLPTGDEIGVTAAAMLLGSGVGFVLEGWWVRFDTQGTVGKKALRMVIGGIGMFVLRLGLKAAFGGLEPVMVFRFVRYTLIGLWFSVIAPWLFVKLGLAGQKSVI